MKNKWNKRGSVTVLVMMLMVTMISMIMAFVHATKLFAVKGVSSELGLLWCESVLGEYDKNLQSRYGIFAFYGIASDVSGTIDEYALESFGDKNYLNYQGSQCDLYEYSLASVKNFRKQIVKEGKLVSAGIVKAPEKTIRAAETGMPTADSKVLFSDLPSDGIKSGLRIGSVKSLVGNGWKDALTEGSNRYFENRYILTFFQNNNEDYGGKDKTSDDSSSKENRPLDQGYFRGEVEYILAGKNTDSQNEKTVKRVLVALRTAASFQYILTDPGMQAKTAAAAALLAPEAQPAMQKAIEAAWSLAEGRNDYQLLVHGEKVPWKKTSESWAVDLDSIVKSYSESKGEDSLKKKVTYINPGNTTGQTYEDYLMFLLSVMNQRVKLMRAMSVIQINMRHYYYESFRIRDYNVGLSVELKMNGSSIHVEKTY